MQKRNGLKVSHFKTITKLFILILKAGEKLKEYINGNKCCIFFFLCSHSTVPWRQDYLVSLVATFYVLLSNRLK